MYEKMTMCIYNYQYISEMLNVAKMKKKTENVEMKMLNYIVF